MDVLIIIGIIVLIIIAFVFFGLLGWVLKAFGYEFDFLQEGWSTCFGCLFWVLSSAFFYWAFLRCEKLKEVAGKVRFCANNHSYCIK